MSDYSSLQNEVSDLKSKVESASVSPYYLGGILEHFLNKISSIDMSGLAPQIMSAIENAQSALESAQSALESAGLAYNAVDAIKPLAPATFALTCENLLDGLIGRSDFSEWQFSADGLIDDVHESGIKVGDVVVISDPNSPDTPEIRGCVVQQNDIDDFEVALFYGGDYFRLRFIDGGTVELHRLLKPEDLPKSRTVAIVQDGGVLSWVTPHTADGLSGIEAGDTLLLSASAGSAQSVGNSTVLVIESTSQCVVAISNFHDHDADSNVPDIYTFWRNDAHAVDIASLSCGGDAMINIEYADLVELRDNNNLKPGTLYRITDYVTTVANDPKARSAGHVFDIIVKALDSCTLSEEASAIKSPRDTDGYFSNCRLEAWKIWYSLDNDIKRFQWADPDNGRGVIWRMIDEWNNDCPYDFKNIQFKRFCSDVDKIYNFPRIDVYDVLRAFDDTIGITDFILPYEPYSGCEYLWRYTFDSGTTDEGEDQSACEFTLDWLTEGHDYLYDYRPRNNVITPIFISVVYDDNNYSDKVQSLNNIIFTQLDWNAADSEYYNYKVRDNYITDSYDSTFSSKCVSTVVRNCFDLIIGLKFNYCDLTSCHRAVLASYGCATWGWNGSTVRSCYDVLACCNSSSIVNCCVLNLNFTVLNHSVVENCQNVKTQNTFVDHVYQCKISFCSGLSLHFNDEKWLVGTNIFNITGGFDLNMYGGTHNRKFVSLTSDGDIVIWNPADNV